MYLMNSNQYEKDYLRIVYILSEKFERFLTNDWVHLYATAEGNKREIRIVGLVMLVILGGVAGLYLR
jgi:hypothetical protein